MRRRAAWYVSSNSKKPVPHLNGTLQTPQVRLIRRYVSTKLHGVVSQKIILLLLPFNDTVGHPRAGRPWRM